MNDTKGHVRSASSTQKNDPNCLYGDKNTSKRKGNIGTLEETNIEVARKDKTAKVTEMRQTRGEKPEESGIIKTNLGTTKKSFKKIIYNKEEFS